MLSTTSIIQQTKVSSTTQAHDDQALVYGGEIQLNYVYSLHGYLRRH